MKGTAEGSCIFIDLVPQVGIEEQLEINNIIKTDTIFIIQITLFHVEPSLGYSTHLHSFAFDTSLYSLNYLAPLRWRWQTHYIYKCFQTAFCHQKQSRR